MPAYIISVHIVVYFLASLVFALLLRPLWQLTKGRIALLIILSRALATLMSALVCGALFKSAWYGLNMQPSVKWHVKIMECVYYLAIALDRSIDLHPLLMALNRCHGIMWPINYLHFSTRRRILYQIAGIYVIGVGWALSIKIYPSWPKIVHDEYLLYFSQIFSLIIYFAILVRMVVYKYTRNTSLNNQHNAVEKDFLKITLCCGISIFFNVCMNVLHSVAAGTSANVATGAISDKITTFLWQPAPVVSTVFYTLAAIIGVGGFSEELCLMALCREFRRNIRVQFQQIWRLIRSAGRKAGGGAKNVVAVQPIGRHVDGIKRADRGGNAMPNGNGSGRRIGAVAWS